jgi:23S rRNA pseudouridine2605 synthase
MSEERLQKILARAGIASRRKAEELIREARVTVNGRAAEIGDKADLERDAVKVDGKRLLPRAGAHRYLLLNKPKGVMSTLSDPEGRTTVLDLVPPRFQKALVPVGRLDFNTEGLLLLTDDGDFAQEVAHPRHGCVKTYDVKVKGQPADRDLDRLRAGIVLDGRRTAPCRIGPRPASRRAAESENSWWKVELSEGRSRQIREMFQRIGHPVQKLRRVAIGPVADPDLPLGMVRELTEREVELLRGAARRAAAGKGRPVAQRPARPAERSGGGERRAAKRPGAARTPRARAPRSRG